jgi:hypothetical protein
MAVVQCRLQISTKRKTRTYNNHVPAQGVTEMLGVGFKPLAGRGDRNKDDDSNLFLSSASPI